MITKERLEELIEQGATIYSVEDTTILEIKANELYYSKSNDNYQYNEYFFVYEFNEEDLYESREEAEWYKEFGCIERTERLELPTWEENKPIERIFSTPNGSSYCLKARIKTGYSIEKENPYIIRIFKFGESDNFIDFEFTKENYTLACRKCKELFLGEKK